MQIVDSWHYRRGVPRCQRTMTTRQRFFLFNRADSLFRFDSMQRVIETRIHGRRFSSGKTIMIGDDMLQISFAPLSAHKFTNVSRMFTGATPYIRTQLASIYKENREGFAIANFKNRLIYISGGHADFAQESVMTFNLRSNKFCDIAPLNYARQGHSSIAHMNQIFVIGGKQNFGIQSSIEMLDTCWHKEAWVIINTETSISDHITLLCPAVSTDQIIIIGQGDH